MTIDVELTVERDVFKALESRDPALVEQLVSIDREYPMLADLVIELWTELETLRREYLINSQVILDPVGNDAEIKDLEFLITGGAIGMALFFRLAEVGFLSVSEILTHLRCEDAITWVAGLTEARLCTYRGQRIIISTKGEGLGRLLSARATINSTALK